MNRLYISGTDQTPTVDLHKQNNIFSLEGRSLTDDADTFYRPVIEWMNLYLANPNPATCFTFKFDYINTPSSKMVFDILTLLGQIKGASAIWYFREGEEGIREIGEEFSELVQFPFKERPY